MTIEEKARAYDKALEKANWLEIVDCPKNEALEELFPQLKDGVEIDSDVEKIIKAIKCAFHFIPDGKLPELPIDIKSVVAWLEKQKKQKPAEWSEEDEVCYNSIIEHLKYSITNGKPETYRSGRLTDWLKSLKERYAWKPSDEQMEALRRMKAAIAGEGEIYGPLNSLYEDLKKMKGE